MKTIWKYQLTPGLNISMPKGAIPLSVQAQNEIPCLWALVDDIAEPESRVVSIYGIGHVMPDDPGTYIGTFQIHDGELVFHVFLK